MLLPWVRSGCQSLRELPESLSCDKVGGEGVWGMASRQHQAVTVEGNGWHRASYWHGNHWMIF